MILKGSQRGGAGQLARHLLREDENDHVEVLELRGFVSDDLTGALAEAHAVSKGTRCSQFLFSLSINPPKDQNAGLDDILDAVERAERQLGLDGQPRAIVVHEKQGRRHAHVVWSRIDAMEMKARSLPFFKNQLSTLSKDLYLEHGWDLPDGHKENGWKNSLNFTLAEWQQCKRLGLHPAELKQLFREAWQQSDGLAGFKAGLEDRGYFLAAGDRRGFVAVDLQGEVFSVSRMTGVKTGDLEARLGSPDGLPSVDAAKASIERRIPETLRKRLHEFRDAQREKIRSLDVDRLAAVRRQREERARLTVLQGTRWAAETRLRQERLNGGLKGVWDILTGRAAAVRRANDHEAFDAYRRDRMQRELLYQQQRDEHQGLQAKLALERSRQRQELMELARHTARLLARRDTLPTREMPPTRHVSRHDTGRTRYDY